MGGSRVYNFYKMIQCIVFKIHERITSTSHQRIFSKENFHGNVMKRSMKNILQYKLLLISVIQIVHPVWKIINLCKWSGYGMKILSFLSNNVVI